MRQSWAGVAAWETMQFPEGELEAWGCGAGVGLVGVGLVGVGFVGVGFVGIGMVGGVVGGMVGGMVGWFGVCGTPCEVPGGLDGGLVGGWIGGLAEGWFSAGLLGGPPGAVGGVSWAKADPAKAMVKRTANRTANCGGAAIRSRPAKRDGKFMVCLLPTKIMGTKPSSIGSFT